MVEDFDDFVRELEAQIHQETREAYGEKAFERWRKPRFMGVLTKPDGYGRVTGTCGDTMEIFLRVEEEIVKEASFQTDGCGSSMVCGSFAAEMCLEKTPDEILEITGEAILEELGGLPREDQHCAFLASETLQEALHDYMVNERRHEKEKSHP